MHTVQKGAVAAYMLKPSSAESATPSSVTKARITCAANREQATHGSRACEEAARPRLQRPLAQGEGHAWSRFPTFPTARVTRM